MTRPADLTKSDTFKDYWKRLRKVALDWHNDYADLTRVQSKTDRATASRQLKQAIALTLVHDDDTLRFDWEPDEQDCDPPEFDKGRKGEVERAKWEKKHESGEYSFYSLVLAKVILDEQGNLDHDETVDVLSCIEIDSTRRGGRQADRDYKFLSYEAEMAEAYLYNTYGPDWWRPFIGDRFALIEMLEPDELIDQAAGWPEYYRRQAEMDRHDRGPSKRMIELDTDEELTPKLSLRQRREADEVAKRLVGRTVCVGFTSNRTRGARVASGRLDAGGLWQAYSNIGMWEREVWHSRSNRGERDSWTNIGGRPLGSSKVVAPQGLCGKIIRADVGYINESHIEHEYTTYINVAIAVTNPPRGRDGINRPVFGATVVILGWTTTPPDRPQSYLIYAWGDARSFISLSFHDTRSALLTLALSHHQKPADYKRPIELDGLSLRFWEK